MSGKPDVLVRLAAFSQIIGQTDEPMTAEMARWGSGVIADAIDAINDLRREIAEQRPEEGR